MKFRQLKEGTKKVLQDLRLMVERQEKETDQMVVLDKIFKKAISTHGNHAESTDSFINKLDTETKQSLWSIFNRVSPEFQETIKAEIGYLLFQQNGYMAQAKTAHNMFNQIAMGDDCMFDNQNLFNYQQ